ncbi:MAG: hypothetical protein QF473_27460, partial [Planctomycetota bacterium]|nr:hypothetical protein [Planctomycetota bacterium]
MTTYLSDMSKCLPQSAHCRSIRAGHWRLLEYESDEVSGTMMFAGPLTDVPDVSYPLDVEGWHAIYIGYATQIHGEHVAVKARLQSDPCFQTIADDELDGLEVMTIREVFWRYADLTGEQIVFRQHSRQAGIPGIDGFGRRSGGVAFVKLEPLLDTQVTRIREDRADTSRRRVIVSNDGGCIGALNVTTEEDILEHVELYRNSDVGRIDWSVVSGEIAKYPSRIGDNLHERDSDVAFSAYGKAYVDNLRTLIDKGLIPHRVAMKHAHSIGMQFYYMFRMALGPSTGPLFEQRPELCMVDRDGTHLPKLSFAFAEVQQRVLDLMQEVDFFTRELSERYEEIDLLYSISETLGSILILEEATEEILKEVCDVLGAERGSLWVYDRNRDLLRLTASVGPGSDDPLDARMPDLVTSRVFEEGRSQIGGRGGRGDPRSGGATTDISVPISYSRRSVESRIVGVIDLFRRLRADPFTTSDKKLL